MALSRLENFLKNAEGNLLYVNPTDFDATDSVENRGNSLTRPFKTIQRALIESAAFSYVSGRNNDKNDRTTILVYPGIHYVDNRPGISVQNSAGSAVYRKRTGVNTWTTTTLNEFSSSSNFDLFDVNNDLYKFNSINGGVILPRGTSIIGLDLRKTKIRPLYVPDPLDNDVELSSIFNVTGTCYFSTFTIFDADPQKSAVKNYNDTLHVPNFSHHKLTAFAYADGVNNVLLGSEETGLTDLDMYYYKVARAYGDLSGRGIADYPNALDFEPAIDEYRIVGDLSVNAIGISSIYSGDGINPSNVITVTTSDPRTGLSKEHGLFVDSPISITGITTYTDTYNGSFTVREVVGLTTFTFTTPSIPPVANINQDNYIDGLVTIETDNVSSASPYIFNCSLRSVYGMCGMVADGDKADGFKSMVVAQFTGVSLQKDNNAFLVYENGQYFDNLTLPTVSRNRPLYRNSKSIYKPSHESYHIKVTNNAFIQCVSIFAIGYAKHFVAESGGDMSITNSNSNFGALSLESGGFRSEAFDRDDVGYVTHIIPPKDIEPSEVEINWLSIDATKTRAVANSTRLYLFNQTNRDQPPQHLVDNFRIGARENDLLYLTLTQGTTQTTHTARILMPVVSGSGISSKKVYEIQRVNGRNNIVSNTGTITLATPHQLSTGEKVRIYNELSSLPDGLSNELIYYAIRLNETQIQLASSLNDANSGNNIRGIGDNGNITNIISYVTDKLPGEVGHPIQYDEGNTTWYITVNTDNQIYNNIVALNISGETASSFFKRIYDNRSIEDRIYKVRYVIPKEFINARPPQAGFILQESSTVGLTTSSYTNSNLLSNRDKRNEKIISNAVAGTITNGVQPVTLTIETPHNFSIGDKIKVEKIRSTNNITGVGIISTFNGTHEITSIPSPKTLTYNLRGSTVNPGNFSNNVNQRTTRQQVENLPLVSRNEYKNNYFIYRVDTVKQHISGESGQDGVYTLIILESNASLDSTYGFNLSSKKFNQDVRNLYPQLDRDNFNLNPQASITKADPNIIGKVITNNKTKSITKEFVNSYLENNNIGIGISNIALSGIGNTTVTVTLKKRHNLNAIKSFTPTTITPFNNTYSVLLSGGNGSDASFKVIGNAVSIIDPGCSYNVNDQGTITDGTNTGTITVTETTNNLGDAVELHGFIENDINTSYRIVSIPTSNSIVLEHPTGISTYVPNANLTPFAYLSAKGIPLNNISLSNTTTGITTVTTTEPHGLSIGNKFSIVGSSSSIFNGSFTVNDVVGINTFRFKILNANSSGSSTTGTILKNGISVNARNVGRGEENLNSRACYFYAGISTTLNGNLNSTNTTITLTSSNGFYKGDYVLVEGEIIRLISDPVGNQFTVQRGQLSTVKVSAIVGTQVKKIKVIPTEIRRPSFLRASGHTFEYLGYGPGNYSTGMPQKQNIVLDEDRVILSQAREVNGGTVVYTGMNDLGEFYTGSKKLVSSTGEEQVVDAPIVTYTGDDAIKKTKNIQSSIFDNVLIRDSITIEGGESSNEASQFFGQVNFTNKVTALSQSGVEVRNLYIRGTSAESKLITVGIQTPTASIIPSISAGDVSLLSNPSANYVGHIYKNAEWRPFGLISEDSNSINLTVDRLGIGRTARAGVALDVSNDTRLQNLRVDGTFTVSQPLSLGGVSFENINVGNTNNPNISGISTIGMIEIVSNGDGGIIRRRQSNNAVGVLTYIGDGSQLTGIDLTRIVSGTSNISVANNSTISANVSGQNIFNVTGTGVTMVSGRRFDLSSYTESIQTFGSTTQAATGTLNMDLSQNSTFVIYINDTNNISLNPINIPNNRMVSWIIILKHITAGEKHTRINYANPTTVRFPGGKTQLRYSVNNGDEDTLTFYTIDGGANIFGNVGGISYIL